MQFTYNQHHFVILTSLHHPIRFMVELYLTKEEKAS